MIQSGNQEDRNSQVFSHGGVISSVVTRHLSVRESAPIVVQMVTKSLLILTRSGSKSGSRIFSAQTCNWDENILSKDEYAKTTKAKRHLKDLRL